MDMGDESGSGSGFVKEEERDLISETSLDFDDGFVKVELNGEVDHSGDGGIGAQTAAGEKKINGEVRNSPLNSIGSPTAAADSEEGTPTPASKGKGLKKWRRIRRDTSKDFSVGVDSSRVLKRGLSAAETGKPRDENKQKSDGEGESSVASVDVGKLGGVSQSEATVGNLDPELELLVTVGGFSVGAGTDSENSEDRSSKSSTAASAPRHKHDGFGFGRERVRGKNFSGKGASSHFVQLRGHRGKGGLDSSKKIREDQTGIKEWHSSVESGLRSSNAILMQCGSTSSNGRHGEESVNYDGENSDEAQVSEDVETDCYKGSGGEVEGISREDLCDDSTKEEKREENESSEPQPDQDPFTESITLLQAAQEALEKEIQKFEEIGKELVSEPDSLSGQFQFEETEEISSLPLESKLIYLSKKVDNLESKLQEASIEAKAREVKMLELEGILSENQSQNSKTEGTGPLLRERCREMELELENLFKKKLEVEIECLALRRATKTWKVMVEDQFALTEEQKSLYDDYDHLIVKFSEVEEKALVRAEELEASCKELLGADGVLSLQNGAVKFSLCFFLQLVMLCVAFWLFIVQLFPLTNEVVPT